MLISRKMAHRLQSRLQILMSLAELGKTEALVDEIHSISGFINAHLETDEEEKARRDQEE